MSTENIADELEEIAEEVHQLDYGSGHLFSTLRRIVETMTAINDEVALIRKEIAAHEKDKTT